MQPGAGHAGPAMQQPYGWVCCLVPQGLNSPGARFRCRLATQDIAFSASSGDVGIYDTMHRSHPVFSCVPPIPYLWQHSSQRVTGWSCRGWAQGVQASVPIPYHGAGAPYASLRTQLIGTGSCARLQSMSYVSCHIRHHVTNGHHPP